LLACATGKGDADLTKPVTGVEASNAGKAYEKGVTERKQQNFAEATRYFEFVKNNFPYSQYAALAELNVGDMSYDRDEWGAAAVFYGDFVKSHPSHPQAGYAAYRVGLAHYNDRPSDWFLLPPSYEKDQAPLRAAMDGFSRFLTNYPKSEFVPKAQIELTDCRERLVAHERYVAEFYEKKNEWRGAANRYLSIADSFGDLRDGHLRGDMLWRAAEAYRSFKDAADERATLIRFVQEAPGDTHRAQAEAMIKALPADAKPPELMPVPVPGVPPLITLEPAKAAPITPAEAPGAPEGNPKPAGPTNHVPPPPEQPVSQPATPPLAQPDK